LLVAVEVFLVKRDDGKRPATVVR